MIDVMNSFWIYLQRIILFKNLKINNVRIVELRIFQVSSSNNANKPVSFEDWVLAHFGPSMNAAFFRPYNEKIWTTRIDRLSACWVGSRVAKLPAARLEALCRMPPEQLASTDLGWGPNAEFGYPKRGGTGAVWQGMCDKLPTEWFRFRHTCTEVDPVHKSVTVIKPDGSQEQLEYDILVSTAPLDWLMHKTRLCTQPKLHRTRVLAVGVGLKLPVTPSIQNRTWLYVPDPGVPFYRVSLLSSFGDDVTPDPHKFWSLLLECALSEEECVFECDEETEVSAAKIMLRLRFCRMRPHATPSRSNWPSWKPKFATLRFKDWSPRSSSRPNRWCRSGPSC